MPEAMARRIGRILFFPKLAGATLADRAVACVGALFGIALTGLVCRAVGMPAKDLPLLVGPIGASAVLLFAIPASPLAQPWSIIGGNTVSAIVGVAMGRLIPDPMIAAGAAVALAIAAMSVTRCLHPPGGGVALTAAAGGPAILSAGYIFALAPVALNSVLLVATGWLFHRLSCRSYPHRVAPVKAGPRLSFSPEDIDRALGDLGETFDMSRADIDRLFVQVELRAAEREAANKPLLGARP